MQELIDQKQVTGPYVTMHPNTLLKRINEACRRADVPQVGIHGLRRSFCSLAITHLHLQEDEIMRLGGWKNFTTMRKVYTKLSAKDYQQSIDKLIEFYR